MSLSKLATDLGERVAWPDALTLGAIDLMVGQTRRRLARCDDDTDRRFVRDMNAYPVAVHTDAANAQHYELPAEFFTTVLGPRCKYSCCLFENDATSLAAAEEAALAATAEHAALADGQRILELGCGWGSLSLWMAETLPAAQIVAVSNSRTQREYILGKAADAGLTNLEVLTADMNDFAPTGIYDRVVSVEMFEHMSNWRPLLERAKSCLAPDGRLFLHVFSHREAPYRFDHTNRDDWIAQHFFTGGIMPSHGLIGHFDDLFTVEAEWRWNGVEYQRTARAWLKNFDSQGEKVDRILKDVYGRDWRLWRRRWRLFFLATMGLFGHASGDVWGVSHYRLAPRP
jgi:cyclopropane-fatty-acyl-phospholipid synthase